MSTESRTVLHAKLIAQIRHLIASSILSNQKIAERFGLHLTDMQCINLLDLVGPVTPGKLAEYTGLTTGGVTVMLDRLERAGYIRREPSPTDRRSVLVHVNLRKLKKIGSAYERINEQMEALLAATPEKELQAAANLFSRMNSVRVDGDR